MAQQVAQLPTEISFENVNGTLVLPFDHKDTKNYPVNIFTLRKQFNQRIGADLPVRFMATNGTPLYLHFQKKNLCCMKINIGDDTLGNPWLLGLGSTDQHIGVSEGYGKAKVGYWAFRWAVDEIVRLLLMGPVKENQWRTKVNSALTTILHMTIEPVRFHVLFQHDNRTLIQPKFKSRDPTTGETALINAWGSISRCLEGEMISAIIEMTLEVTEDLVVEAERNTSLARLLIAVPCIEDIDQ